jgi:hypothetical protein
VGSWCDRLGDLREVQVHRLGIAGRQDQGRALELRRADDTEDAGGSGALVTGCTWTRAALCPSADEFVLLADRAPSANKIPPASWHLHRSGHYLLGPVLLN